MARTTPGYRDLRIWRTSICQRHTLLSYFKMTDKAWTLQTCVDNFADSLARKVPDIAPQFFISLLTSFWEFQNASHSFGLDVADVRPPCNNTCDHYFRFDSTRI